MAYPALKYVSAEEYLEMERDAIEKHEYFDGRVYALAGASDSHNRIVRNLIGELHNFLKGKTCEVFPSDMRITTPGFNSYMYPDISIVCGELEKQENSFDTLTNPSVIIEVTSTSTVNTDLGVKLFRYLQIASLTEYILVDSTRQSIRTIRKQSDDTFKIITAEGADGVVDITSIGLKLQFKDIYYKVSFTDDAEA